MERDSYLDGVRSAWLGERMGEAFFSALAERSADASEKTKWQTLARLEAVTGSKMAAVLEAYGEAVDTGGVFEVGEDVVEEYAQATHLDSMTRMKDVVEQAIVRFDQILAVAPDADVPQIQFLVQHEQALLDFVEREIAGDEAHSLDAVEQLLTQSR